MSAPITWLASRPPESRPISRLLLRAGDRRAELEQVALAEALRDSRPHGRPRRCGGGRRWRSRYSARPQQVARRIIVPLPQPSGPRTTTNNSQATVTAWEVSSSRIAPRFTLDIEPPSCLPMLRDRLRPADRGQTRGAKSHLAYRHAPSSGDRLRVDPGPHAFWCGASRSAGCGVLPMLRHQQLHTRFQPAGQPAIVATPEEAVVHQHRIGPLADAPPR